MSSVDSKYRLFVATSPGLEALACLELAKLGVASQPTAGGVECAGSIETLWTVHCRSRLAESVRLRLRPFDARTFHQLELGLRHLPWHAYLQRGAAFDVAVSCRGSRLYHTEAIAERVRGLVEELRSARPAPNLVASADGEPGPTSLGQKIYLRVADNVVQVSIDASGERLHRRGYRTHVGRAPMRETLAAATALLATQLAADAPISRVWDPCCGSGTMLSEWLLMQNASLAHSHEGRFAFENWPIHDRIRYADWLDRLIRAQPNLAAEFQAFGCDHDPRSIAAAQANLGRAELLGHCTLLVQDFRAALPQIPKHTAVVSNLPYGIRLRDRAASIKVFAALDKLLHKRLDLRPVVVLNTLPPPAVASCPWRHLATFANGGLRVNAWGMP